MVAVTRFSTQSLPNLTHLLQQISNPVPPDLSSKTHCDDRGNITQELKTIFICAQIKSTGSPLLILTHMVTNTPSAGISTVTSLEELYESNLRIDEY